MSDPRFRDPKMDPPPLREDEIRPQRLNGLESSNAMWGWVAGAVVLALVLVFVFTRGQVTDTNTAGNVPTAPAATTTGSAPTNNPPPVTQAPKVNPEPSATGQAK